MWREPSPTLFQGKSADFIDGLLEDFSGGPAASDASQFEERADPQRRKSTSGSNSGTASISATVVMPCAKHLGPMQPGEGVIRIGASAL